jgi:hypothetical protein
MDVAEGAAMRTEWGMKAPLAVGLEDRSAVLTMGSDDHSRSWELGCGIHIAKVLESRLCDQSRMI